MDNRLAGFLLLTAGILITPSASAQNSEINPISAAEAAFGYRSEGSERGFRLVTLGVWTQPGGAPSVDTNPQAATRSDTVAKAPVIPRGIRQASFRRSAFLSHVAAAEAQYGLPSGLLDALIWTESHYNTFALSKAGAAGLAQLMPATARDLGVRDRYDPLASIDGGARYLRQLIERFGAIRLAVAAYNAGPNAVIRAGGIPLNKETPGYVRNVFARWSPF